MQEGRGGRGSRWKAPESLIKFLLLRTNKKYNVEDKVNKVNKIEIN